MGTKSCWKNWAVTICAHADRAASSKGVVFGAGRYDGSRRDHFFQGLVIEEGDCPLLITPRKSASTRRSASSSVSGAAVETETDQVGVTR
jgi:hypothetical protein